MKLDVRIEDNFDQLVKVLATAALHNAAADHACLCIMQLLGSIDGNGRPVHHNVIGEIRPKLARLVKQLLDVHLTACTSKNQTRAEMYDDADQPMPTAL